MNFLEELTKANPGMPAQSGLLKACAEVDRLRSENAKLRQALLKTTGCLGLLLGGCNPKGPAYAEAHKLGKDTIAATVHPDI